MKRRKFLQTAGLGAAVLSVSSFKCLKVDNPPNIIIIFTDDQGYADAGCYGAENFKTPNIDRMASGGMRFTSFYVSQAVCSASRASLLTGCYAERVGIKGALMPWAEVGLNPEEETIADILRKRGYISAIYGKWHLGHHKEFLPLEQGFDHYVGLPYSNDMWPVDYDGSAENEGWKSAYPVLPLIENYKKIGEIKTLGDQAKLTKLYTEHALRFIRNNRKRPFFLYLAHSMPHVPLGVSEKYRDKSKQGMYGDVISEIDWSAGEVMKALRKWGIEDNTLVIYASDNGPWLNFGNHAGSADPLREGKGTTFEGGIRVPCIMLWSGHIKENSVCTKMVAAMDVMPTVAEITGASLPKNKIDGVSILPLLKNKSNANPRDHFFFYYGGELRAVRKGRWKLFFPHISRSYQGVKSGKDGWPGELAVLKVELALYDLKNDIGEKKNVAAEHPHIVKDLKKLAENARDMLGDRLRKQEGKEVRQPGRRRKERREFVDHLAVGGKIVLKNRPSPKYPGSTQDALIDGFLGSLSYSDNRWQGFEGTDLEAVIDLQQSVKAKTVKCSFLQNQQAWIFLPAKTEIAISENGKDYKVVNISKQKTEISFKTDIKETTVIFKKRQVRYIRIHAENIGVCPAWHRGAGSKAWLFADEIIVK